MVLRQTKKPTDRGQEVARVSFENISSTVSLESVAVVETWQV